jgi:hypothetical protein
MSPPQQKPHIQDCISGTMLSSTTPTKSAGARGQHSAEGVDMDDLPGISQPDRLSDSRRQQSTKSKRSPSPHPPASGTGNLPYRKRKRHSKEFAEATYSLQPSFNTSAGSYQAASDNGCSTDVESESEIAKKRERIAKEYEVYKQKGRKPRSQTRPPPASSPPTSHYPHNEP